MPTHTHTQVCVCALHMCLYVCADPVPGIHHAPCKALRSVPWPRPPIPPLTGELQATAHIHQLPQPLALQSCKSGALPSAQSLHMQFPPSSVHTMLYQDSDTGKDSRAGTEPALPMTHSPCPWAAQLRQTPVCTQEPPPWPPTSRSPHRVAGLEGTFLLLQWK